MSRKASHLCLVAGIALVGALPAPQAAAGRTCDGKAATIEGTSGKDFIYGTEGDDVIAAGAARDVVIGKGGDDRICGNAGKDRIAGEGGADRLFLNKGDVVNLSYNLNGGPGADFLKGAGSGGPGPDHIVVKVQDNAQIYGEEGDDVIEAPDTDLVLVDGGEGDDQIYGGNDLRGGPGKDILRGDGAGVGQGGRDDTLTGGQGDDDLRGGPGEDSVDGGQDTDICEGETETNCENDPTG